MHLRDWIIDEHAGVLARFEQSVASRVPRDRWTEPVGSGGSSIAWLMFHTSYHEDLAVNAVLRDRDTVLTTARSVLGLADIPSEVGLGETEDADLTTSLDLGTLDSYVRDVHDATQSWLAEQSESGFAALVEAELTDGPAALARAGIAEADVPWLYRMWDGKPPRFFLQWEATGHRINHLGEMVSVRNRLGLSPFELRATIPSDEGGPMDVQPKGDHVTDEEYRAGG